MDEQHEVDFNDAMFEINNHRVHRQNASISTDTNLDASLSNFGIDIENPEENQLYIQQNQHREAIINVGEVRGADRGISDNSDSGLATSISKTRSSEFVPQIVEYAQEGSVKSLLETISDASETPEASNANFDYDSTNNKLENPEETQRYLTPFDLALEKGYQAQAKIYFDDVISKGLPLKSMFVKTEAAILKEQNGIVNNNGDVETGGNVMHFDDENYWSKELVLQQVYMLKTDFEEYLEHIQQNQFKKVLNKVRNKGKLTVPEAQIERNINTKEKRNNSILKEKTIEIINEYIIRLNQFEIGIKEYISKNLDDKE